MLYFYSKVKILVIINQTNSFRVLSYIVTLSKTDWEERGYMFAVFFVTCHCLSVRLLGHNFCRFTLMKLREIPQLTY